jgi:hypothetical protein
MSETRFQYSPFCNHENIILSQIKMFSLAFRFKFILFRQNKTPKFKTRRRIKYIFTSTATYNLIATGNN